MKLTFLGAAHEVTGSCSLLETAAGKVLIDCGMEQGEDIYENAELPVNPGDIDAVLLTHAHIDHSGMLPALVAKGYNGPIFCTEATKRLSEIMLRDSAHIQESEAEWRSRKAQRSGGEPYQPVYTVADAETALKLMQPCRYGDSVEVLPGVTAGFSDAGHLLGSSSILITAAENGDTRSILFSGDLGNVARPLIRDPATPPAADYVVIESTYGDRFHGPRPDYVGQLTRILQETLDRGGNVVIPAFAVGRTQELLYLIRTIKKEGLVTGHDGFPVYVDSPLAVAATNIYADGLTDFYDDEALELLRQGIDPIKFEGLRLSVTSDESKAINFDDEPKVIISASGMCEAGRIRHHLKHNLWRAESTILFVGYQGEGTFGRKLVDRVPSVKLFGEEIAVRAHVEELAGISGHADKGILLSWLGSMPKAPKLVFVNHGDDVVCDSFASAIKDKLGYEAAAPYSGDCYDLTVGMWLEKAAITKSQRKKANQHKSVTVYDRLMAAVQRLTAVAKAMKNSPNKDISALADRINSLCDKYQK